MEECHVLKRYNLHLYAFSQFAFAPPSGPPWCRCYPICPQAWPSHDWSQSQERMPEPHCSWKHKQINEIKWIMTDLEVLGVNSLSLHSLLFNLFAIKWMMTKTHLLLCSTKECYSFGKTWVWANDDRMFITITTIIFIRWTIPLTLLYEHLTLNRLTTTKLVSKIVYMSNKVCLATSNYYSFNKTRCITKMHVGNVCN